jgi:prolyl oligopeptidase PreP (S9A serine peptidase family)
MTIKLFAKTETKKGVNKEIIKLTWGAMNNAGRVFYSHTELMSVEDFEKFKELFASLGPDDEKRIDTGRAIY